MYYTPRTVRGGVPYSLPGVKMLRDPLLSLSLLVSAVARLRRLQLTPLDMLSVQDFEQLDDASWRVDAMLREIFSPDRSGPQILTLIPGDLPPN